MKEIMLYNQIEDNLISLFDTECPESKSIMTNKDDILYILKKWMDFWVATTPQITDRNSNENKLLFIKKQICETKIVGIFQELEENGLCNEFRDKYCK